MRRKGDVRLQAIIVFREIHQPLRFQLITVGSEKINPLSVAWSRNTVWPTTITGEHFSIRRNVEMHRPFFSRNFVTNGFVRFHVYAGQPEHLTLRSLEVVPEHI